MSAHLQFLLEKGWLIKQRCNLGFFRLMYGRAGGVLLYIFIFSISFSPSMFVSLSLLLPFSLIDHFRSVSPFYVLTFLVFSSSFLFTFFLSFLYINFFCYFFLSFFSIFLSLFPPLSFSSSTSAVQSDGFELHYSLCQHSCSV